jgi:RimJ/RimL family protein N-acetyltransferase
MAPQRNGVGMTAPHEIAVPGPAAAFAAALSAQLPVIETGRLRLRAPGLADFPLWADIFTGPAGTHLGGPFDRDDAFTEYAAAVGLWFLRGHGVWAVDTREGELVGFVLVGFEPGDAEPELGYLFASAAHGKGYATEAAAAARAYAVDRLPSLVSYIDPANTPSRRVVARLGAHPDGLRDGAEVWRHHPATEPAHG